jgi:exosome complex RNA-binding protein Rrp42 (RNase PH superfamily)
MDTYLPTLDKNLKVMTEGGSSSSQLRLSSCPVSFTFCQYEDSTGTTHWLLDPSKEEESVLPRMELIVADDDIVGMYGLQGPTPKKLAGFSMADVLTSIWGHVRDNISARLALIE